jgi:hypothetical protein
VKPSRATSKYITSFLYGLYGWGGCNVNSRKAIHQIDHPGCYWYPGIQIWRSFFFHSFYQPAQLVNAARSFKLENSHHFWTAKLDQVCPMLRSTGIWKKFGSEYSLVFYVIMKADEFFSLSTWLYTRLPRSTSSFYDHGRCVCLCVCLCDS